MIEYDRKKRHAEIGVTSKSLESFLPAILGARSMSLPKKAGDVPNQYSSPFIAFASLRAE